MIAQAFHWRLRLLQRNAQYVWEPSVTCDLIFQVLWYHLSIFGIWLCTSLPCLWEVLVGFYLFITLLWADWAPISLAARHLFLFPKPLWDLKLAFFPCLNLLSAFYAPASLNLTQSYFMNYQSMLSYHYEVEVWVMKSMVDFISIRNSLSQVHLVCCLELWTHMILMN